MRYLIIVFLLPIILSGQSFEGSPLHRDLTYYLPDVNYNTNITSPESFLGHQVGEWHISHDRLVSYMQLLAEESDRINIEKYAESYEGRPLLLLTISQKKHIENIEEIRKKHLEITQADKSKKLNLDELPIVIYQGYSIHGNESSGANAAVLMAYYLAAAQGERVEKLLNNSVILLDPCYNPDGFHRFSTWANMHKSKSLVSDSQDREYNEVWPGGRTNHYWFDLNRDWLLLTHPESRGRIANFQKWRPNILTDHHEMGTNSTFFFQPGVPERTNPNTPQINQTLTEKIGTFHAKALDDIGSMYYTKESFDDFYYGKGSTYPDIQGCIGILFEQASSRGHYQESVHGILDFPFTIRNQVVTSLSTQDAAMALKKDILEYQRDFYLKSPIKYKKSYYKIPKMPDYNKAHYMVELLDQHSIEVYDDNDKNGYFYIPAQQQQAALLHSIFEIVKDFKVNVFYDVSSWTFPLAFDIEVNQINGDLQTENLTKFDSSNILPAAFPKNKDEYVALAFEWKDWKAGRLLAGLTSKGIYCRAMKESFTAEIDQGEKSFDRGTIVIPLGANPKWETIKSLAKEHNIHIFGLKTGFNNKGITLGSPSSINIEEVKAMLIIGDGVNAYDAGEIWFQMDQRLQIPLSKIESYKIKNSNLSRYNTIFMADGNYRNMDKKGWDVLDQWTKNGGRLIVFKRAIKALQGAELLSIETVPSAPNETKESYEKTKEKSAKHVIGGAIFETTIDTSHPLFYGYSDDSLPIFKKGTLVINTNSNGNSPMKYTATPLLSGYSSDENISRIANTPAVIIKRHGKGKIIASVDNPLFRGYWIGGNKLFDNMIFF